MTKRDKKMNLSKRKDTERGRVQREGCYQAGCVGAGADYRADRRKRQIRNRERKGEK